jgi:hypothetical protein
MVHWLGIRQTLASQAMDHLGDYNGDPMIVRSVSAHSWRVVMILRSLKDVSLQSLLVLGSILILLLLEAGTKPLIGYQGLLMRLRIGCGSLLLILLVLVTIG